MQVHLYGIGAIKKQAHFALHIPNALLHATTVAGAEIPAVAPHVAPAAP